MHVDRFKIKEFMAKKKIDNFSELVKILCISKNQLSNILSNRCTRSCHNSQWKGAICGKMG